jgi:hypothetical protein
MDGQASDEVRLFSAKTFNVILKSDPSLQHWNEARWLHSGGIRLADRITEIMDQSNILDAA